MPGYDGACGPLQPPPHRATLRPTFRGEMTEGMMTRHAKILAACAAALLLAACAGKKMESAPAAVAPEPAPAMMETPGEAAKAIVLDKSVMPEGGTLENGTVVT